MYNLPRPCFGCLVELVDTTQPPAMYALRFMGRDGRHRTMANKMQYVSSMNGSNQRSNYRDPFEKQIENESLYTHLALNTSFPVPMIADCQTSFRRLASVYRKNYFTVSRLFIGGTLITTSTTSTFSSVPESPQSPSTVLTLRSFTPFQPRHEISEIADSERRAVSLFRYPSSLSASSLAKLTLHNNYDSNVPDAANHVIEIQSLRTLFGFVNLTSISILSPIGIDLDNTTVLDLARAWPRIETLELSSYYCASPRPRVTLECLHSFARHCPHLRALTMTLDGTVIPVVGAPHRVCQHQLDHLGVEYSAISTPIEVARLLSAVFPNLKDIGTDREDQDNEDLDEGKMVRYDQAITFHNLWKEVEGLLPHLLAIREEEWAWANNDALGS
ncbi:hypothetical protein C8R44DRAFT_733946 [Mycena epipterygia]|nr:hypothetical protein C8R44DRAFT_733946 [Mycena epipterygia]